MQGSHDIQKGVNCSVALVLHADVHTLMLRCTSVLGAVAPLLRYGLIGCSQAGKFRTQHVLPSSMETHSDLVKA